MRCAQGTPHHRVQRWLHHSAPEEGGGGAGMPSRRYRAAALAELAHSATFDHRERARQRRRASAEADALEQEEAEEEQERAAGRSSPGARSSHAGGILPDAAHAEPLLCGRPVACRCVPFALPHCLLREACRAWGGAWGPKIGAKIGGCRFACAGYEPPAAVHAVQQEQHAGQEGEEQEMAEMGATAVHREAGGSGRRHAPAGGAAGGQEEGSAGGSVVNVGRFRRVLTHCRSQLGRASPAVSVLLPFFVGSELSAL
jgi:hypothetical protein